MELILKYFPNLTDTQRLQFAKLKELYEDWNSKINVISRKDMDNFYEHHVLHSLAIAHEIKFRDGSRILDLGTGGGFPGIPLAIMFPECQFKMIDRTGKKIRVVNEVAQAIALKNVVAEQLSGEVKELEPEATDTDRWALYHGYVAVTPQTLDTTAYALLKDWKAE